MVALAALLLRAAGVPPPTTEEGPMRPCLRCGALIRTGSRCTTCAIKRPANTRAWRETRQAVLARAGYRCYRCGNFATQVDHVIPVSRGGSSAEGNLAAICGHCNASKRDGQR